MHTVLSPHVVALCQKSLDCASELARRYGKVVFDLENLLGRFSSKNQEQLLVQTTCLLSEVELAKKEQDASIQVLTETCGLDNYPGATCAESPNFSDAKTTQFLARVENAMAHLDFVMTRAEMVQSRMAETGEMEVLEELAGGKASPSLLGTTPSTTITSSGPSKSLKVSGKSFHTSADNTLENIFTDGNTSTTSRNTSTSRDCSISDHSSRPKLINKNGRWIRNCKGIDMENPETQRSTAFGRLKRDFDRQCLNILILEKERNTLLLKANTLESANKALDAKYARLLTEVTDLRQTVAALRRKLSVEESKWSRRLEVATSRLSKAQRNASLDVYRPNSSANLASSK